MTDTLPKGFEHIDHGERHYRKQTEKHTAGPRRGPPGGPGRTVEKAKDAKGTLIRLTAYFVRSRQLMAGLISIVVAVTATALVAPAVQGQAIDAIKEGQWDILPGLLIFLTVVYGLDALFSMGQSLLSARLSQRIVRDLRHDLFQKIDHLSIGYMDTHSNGDLMSRMTNDIDNISSTISQSLASLVSGVLTIVGTIAIMLFYCWQLTLISLVSVSATVLFTKSISKPMRGLFRRRSVTLGQLNGHAEEMISGYKTVVAYNMCAEVQAEFDATSDELARTSIKAELLGGLMGPVMEIISNLSFVIVAAFGGYFALRGYITIGVISSFIIYAKQFSRPIDQIANLYSTIQTAIAGAERVFQLMDQPDEDNSGTLPMEPVDGHISFRHVNFSYVPGSPVLRDFSLDILPGQKIALVGATGSGKTTVINLLMRFYPIDSGEILVDGKNIMDIRRSELRNATAIVLQDTVLFSDTVANNLRYGNRAATNAQMEAAARTGHAHEFIHRLPQSYDTQLKQAGAALSQGQRQLMSITRAVLSDPKILILDEATSSVDTRTELAIQDAMARLMKARTSLIIAHRLSTIQDADKIVVLDKGRIVESGTHQELLDRKGKYFELYTIQFAGLKT